MIYEVWRLIRITAAFASNAGIEFFDLFTGDLFVTFIFFLLADSLELLYMGGNRRHPEDAAGWARFTIC